MKIIQLKNDVHLLYVTANSFPDGIEDAFQKLHALISNSSERKIFGLSRPENNVGIVYRAAVEETTDGEAEKLNCERLTLKKGRYYSIFISDFKNDTSLIQQAFQLILQQTNVDPNGYCVEMYEKDNVTCLVRIKE